MSNFRIDSEGRIHLVEGPSETAEPSSDAGAGTSGGQAQPPAPQPARSSSGIFRVLIVVLAFVVAFGVGYSATRDPIVSGTNGKASSGMTVDAGTGQGTTVSVIGGSSDGARLGDQGSSGDSMVAETDEGRLRSAVEKKAKQGIIHWFYADMNNDGAKEAFAVTGLPDENYGGSVWKEGEVWYASGGEAIRLAGKEGGNYLNGLVEDPSKGYKYLSLEHEGFGSGSSSAVYAAVGGACRLASFSPDYVGNFNEKDGQLVGYISKFDNGYHEYEWHTFEFDPSSFEFRSTGIIDMTKNQ